MKIAITIIMMVVFFLFVAETTIQIKPFKVSFGSIWQAIGWMLITIGFVVLSVSVRQKAYEEGLKKGIEIEHEAAVMAATEIINESKNAQEHESN